MAQFKKISEVMGKEFVAIYHDTVDGGYIPAICLAKYDEHGRLVWEWLQEPRCILLSRTSYLDRAEEAVKASGLPPIDAVDAVLSIDTVPWLVDCEEALVLQHIT